MFCPLLDKLSPELRTRIWQYVLTFDTPLRHATDLKPFFDQDEIPENKKTAKPYFARAVEALQYAGLIRSEIALVRVDTSILTTNKKIYLEAIAEFYKLNTIVFDGSLFALDPANDDRLNTSLPCGSDFWLANHIIARVDVSRELETSGRMQNLDKASALAFALAASGHMETFYQRLKSATVYLYTDAATDPAHEVLWSAGRCRVFLQSCGAEHSVHFDGVGSMEASMPARPKIQLKVQYRAMMQYWVDGPARKDDRRYIVYRYYSRIKADPESGASKGDISFTAQIRDCVSPDWSSLDPDGFEFWTLAACFLNPALPPYRHAR